MNKCSLCENERLAFLKFAAVEVLCEFGHQLVVLVTRLLHEGCVQNGVSTAPFQHFVLRSLMVDVLQVRVARAKSTRPQHFALVHDGFGLQRHFIRNDVLKPLVELGRLTLLSKVSSSHWAAEADLVVDDGPQVLRNALRVEKESEFRVFLQVHGALELFRSTHFEIAFLTDSMGKASFENHVRILFVFLAECDARWARELIVFEVAIEDKLIALLP